MTYCGGCHVTSCNSVVRRAEQWSLFEMWVLWSLPTACLLSAQRSVLEGGRERGVWTMSVFLFCTLLVLWLACLNWGFSHTHRLACGLSNDVSVRSWVLKDCLLICTVHLASQQTFLASYFSECIEYKVACMIQVLLTSWNCYISTLHLIHYSLFLTPAHWKSNNANARLVAFTLSLGPCIWDSLPHDPIIF